MSNLKSEPLQLTTDREKDLLAEIGRLLLQLRAAELQAHTLQAKLSDLEADCVKQYDCVKGRPSPLAESLTKAFQTAAADAVRTTLDRGGTVVGEVQGQWRVVSKTCEHGNTECQKCGVGQPVPTIKTPEGKPLLPAAEFAALQIEENKEAGLTECGFQRKSGRTTAMVLKALEFVKQNNSALVTINVHNLTMKKRIKELLRHYADELGVQHGQLSRVHVRDPQECHPSAALIAAAGAVLTLRDNILDDMKETKPTRDPRQDLKVGDDVRFEIEGFIKERQSAGIFQDEDGSDFEPIQYAVKDSINGMNYYVGYHQITKVIGKDTTLNREARQK